MKLQRSLTQKTITAGRPALRITQGTVPLMSQEDVRPPSGDRCSSAVPVAEKRRAASSSFGARNAELIPVATAMTIETKFLRLRQPAASGDPMPDGWRVCWVGGWDRCRVFFVVMVVRQRTSNVKQGVNRMP
jgi:hypothetical protein